jgi:hypothetical protein
VPAVSVAWPMVAPELEKVMVPVGVAGPGGVAGETVVLRVTGEPATDVSGVTFRTDLDATATTTTVQDAELPAKAPVGL